MPWINRAKIRSSAEGATAQSSEAAVKSQTPSTKTRRRP